MFWFDFAPPRRRRNSTLASAAMVAAICGAYAGPSSAGEPLAFETAAARLAGAALRPSDYAALGREAP